MTAQKAQDNERHAGTYPAALRGHLDCHFRKLERESLLGAGKNPRALKIKPVMVNDAA